MRAIMVAAGLGLGLGACASSTQESGQRDVALGSYTFQAAFQVSTAGGPLAVSPAGQFTVTFASSDSLAGFLAAPGLDSALALGFWNGDGFLLYAQVSGRPETLSMKLTAKDGGLGCRAFLLAPPEPPAPATCHITGPA